MNIEYIILIVTIILSAFFSGSEVAIVATSKIKAEQLVQKKERNAKILLKLKQKPNEALITILIGNNIMNVASSAIATKIAIQTFNNISLGIITGIMTLIILTFGEIIPKTFVNKNHKKIALMISPVILATYYLFYPIVKSFAYMSYALNKIMKNTQEDPLVTESEIKYLIQVGEKEGEINQNEKNIINKVFKLDDVTVSKIMTPANKIFSLDWNLTVEQATPLIIEHGYTRIPVHTATKNNIKGIITIQDVIGEIYKGNNEIKLKSIISPAYFVNKYKKLDETLKELQIRNYHVAIVLDNNKTVIGLLTVEDILEELVGEIFDEEDKLDSLIKQINQDEWVVKGKTFIRAINKKINLKLPITNEFKPISRFLLERMDIIKKGKTYYDKENKTLITINEEENQIIKEVTIKKI